MVFYCIIIDFVYIWRLAAYTQRGGPTGITSVHIHLVAFIITVLNITVSFIGRTHRNHQTSTNIGLCVRFFTHSAINEFGYNLETYNIE